MNKRNSIIALIGLFISTWSLAQVEKRVVVEHFTNTRCGICASRNPAFKQNVANHPEVLNITIHPSRPYSSCQLYRHNMVDNDARTNFYGILGGTPRIVVQGNVVSASANYGSPTIFDAHEGKTTPYDLKVKTLKRDDDSLTARIVLYKVAEDTRNTLLLYIPVVEDTLYFNAPNGETVHYNVLRRTLFNSSISAPKDIGDSIELVVRTGMHVEWIRDQISVVAVTQDEDNKEVLQAGKSSDDLIEEKDETANISSLVGNDIINVFPNPSTGIYNIYAESIGNGTVKIVDIKGEVVFYEDFSNEQLVDLSAYSSGVYFLTLTSKTGVVSRKLLKQ